MRLVYTHENKILVEYARDLLESCGIKTELKNEFATGAIGELAPIETWPEVWIVNPRNHDRALDVIQPLLNKQEDSPWQCDSCKEENPATFEFCWHCQQPFINKYTPSF